ncbi:hypothetical protein K440DRAFT_626146 [Wilcoxina mikolae CBS 423.85]|nr:hypothetical protein K440DRAFT_626146 [Wilcoxina mikolae CBS 423.85]
MLHRRLLSTAAASTKPHNLPPTPKPSPPKINHVFPPSPSDIASRTPISNYYDANLQRLRAEAGHRRLNEKGTKPEEPSTYKLGRNVHNKREFSTAVAVDVAVALPPVLPKLWEEEDDDDVTAVAQPPIRVPLLPDNDFARYHRREYVPTVAPPHKPTVSTASEDGESVSMGGFGISELIADIFPGREKGGEEKVEGIIAPRDDDEGDPMTKEKEDALKTFAVLAGVWWFFGEGVMRALGVI